MTRISHLASHAGVRLRAATGTDEESLYELFAAGREDLQAALANLDDARREVLLRQQFRAQREQYLRQFDGLSWDLIVAGERIIGQLLSAPVGDELRLVDIALLPGHRNRGIGEALLRDLLDAAARDGRRVGLHVIDGNPAIRLYQRLGFRPAGERDIYLRMEWSNAAEDA